METDALRAQVDNLQETNINLTIEAQRQAENARLVQMTNNDLRAKLERLSNRNNSMLILLAQKEELTALRAELNSGDAGIKNIDRNDRIERFQRDAPCQDLCPGV